MIGVGLSITRSVLVTTFVSSLVGTNGSYADVVVFFVFYEVSFLGVSYADVSEEVSTTLPFGCSVCFGRGSLKIPMSWLVLVLRQNPKPVGEFPLQGDAAIGPVCPWYL